ncbi:MAG: hypothetical protein LBR72_04545 [Oscillospiraceae bacterium]|nr:hypothetical protein [Oscillospiraceae bacterium]
MQPDRPAGDLLAARQKGSFEQKKENETAQTDTTKSPVERPKRGSGSGIQERRRDTHSKMQIVVDKATRQSICTAFANGKPHDFALFKVSGVRLTPRIREEVDKDYFGIKKLHVNSEHPIKSNKYHKLSKEEKLYNRRISSHRVTNEHAIGFLNASILTERYRNHRKRYGLRMNLLAGICNFDLVAYFRR